jgi:hypothetical protein
VVVHKKNQVKDIKEVIKFCKQYKTLKKEYEQKISDFYEKDPYAPLNLKELLKVENEWYDLISKKLALVVKCREYFWK